MKKVLYWVRDRFWPYLEPLAEAQPPSSDEWSVTHALDNDALEAAYALLKDEFKINLDLVKMVDSKLQSISSLSPIAITIVAAVIAFLIGGKVQQFTRVSILVVAIGGFYIALQFVRAMLAATKGLERKGYYFTRLSDIPPRLEEKKEAYIRRFCKDIADNLRRNREATNGKVDQLALGHEAIKNAVGGLLVVILVLLIISIIGEQP